MSYGCITDCFRRCYCANSMTILCAEQCSCQTHGKDPLLTFTLAIQRRMFVRDDV